MVYGLARAVIKAIVSVVHEFKHHFEAILHNFVPVSNKSPSITDEVKSLKKKGKHTTISG